MPNGTKWCAKGVPRDIQDSSNSFGAVAARRVRLVPEATMETWTSC